MNDDFTIVKLVEGNDGAKPKSRAGRKPDPNKLHFKTIGLRADQWEWIALWMASSDNPTTQMGEMVDRARKFWPLGPDAFGHTLQKPRRKPLPRALFTYAKEHGMTRQEAIATVVEAFFKSQKEGKEDG